MFEKIKSKMSGPALIFTLFGAFVFGVYPHVSLAENSGNGACTPYYSYIFPELPRNTSDLCYGGEAPDNLKTTSNGWTWLCCGSPRGYGCADCSAKKGSRPATYLKFETSPDIHLQWDLRGEDHLLSARCTLGCYEFKNNERVFTDCEDLFYPGGPAAVGAVGSWSLSSVRGTGTASIVCSMRNGDLKQWDASVSQSSPKRTLTVTKTGSGSVTSSPAGINCGTDCTESYTNNTNVTLTATPASGATFSGWSGACTGTSKTCAVTMSAAKTVTAAFSGGTGNTCSSAGGTCKVSCTSGEDSVGVMDCQAGKLCCVASGNSEKIKIDGTCGSAARNYAETVTAFSGSFCRTGLPEPFNPSFPLVNHPSNWTCKGMTGGKDSDVCVASRGSVSPPKSCSVYTVTSSIPEDYGSPFNQLSSAKELFLSATCASNGTTATAGAQNTYVYKTGFVTENGQWKKIDFTGTSAPNNEGWLQGSSVANIPAAPASGQNFIIAFVCQYNGGKWKCGCRNSACTQNYWTLQAYKK